MSKRSKSKPAERPELDYEFVILEPGNLPPLDPDCDVVLQKLREAPQPLSYRQLEKQTTLPLSRISNSIALLMIHQLVESEWNARGAQVWRPVGHEYPAPPPRLPKPPEPRVPKALEGQDELF